MGSDNVKFSSKRPTGKKRKSAVTPLRQVMSMSIQRAIREHGQMSGIVSSPKSPLDLRLSPVIRRSQSDPSPQKFSQTPSLAPPSPGRYMASVRGKIERSMSAKDANKQKGYLLETVYETAKTYEASPKADCSDGQHCKTPKSVHDDHNTSHNDIWFTPYDQPPKSVRHLEVISPGDCSYKSTPMLKMKKRLSKRPLIHQKENFEEDVVEEVDTSKKGDGKWWWSLVSSVFGFTQSSEKDKLADLSGITATPSTPPASIIKRCASFAGELGHGGAPIETKRLWIFHQKGLPSFHRRRRKRTGIPASVAAPLQSNSHWTKPSSNSKTSKDADRLSECGIFRKSNFFYLVSSLLYLKIR